MMVHFLARAAVVYGAFALQMTLSPALEIGGCQPLWSWLALMAIAQHTSGVSGLLWGAGWGVVSDSLGTGQLGVDLMCAVWLTVLWQRLPRQVWQESWWGYLGLAGITLTLGIGASQWGHASPQELQTGWMPLLMVSAGSATYTALVGFGIWWCHRYLTIVPRRSAYITP